jgi:hypothetical protein
MVNSSPGATHVRHVRVIVQAIKCLPLLPCVRVRAAVRLSLLALSPMHGAIGRGSRIVPVLTP